MPSIYLDGKIQNCGDCGGRGKVTKKTFLRQVRESGQWKSNLELVELYEQAD
ncbi:MAG: hypothetical protein V3U54_08745 [Thermodesulfobacteriota bacterium]